MIPMYNTESFNEIYETSEEFINDYKDSGFYSNETDECLNTTYLLLLGRYGSSPIANRTVDRFKIKLHSILFQHANNWSKKIELQKQVRALTLEQLKLGNKVIYNHAYNPGEQPYTASVNELNYINDQNTANYLNSDIRALELQSDMIDERITENYLDYFKVLFKKVVRPDIDDIYYDGGY